MILVTAGIIIHQGHILIAKRADDDFLPQKWEFPGGKIETGETPEACLHRELMEEFGIEVVVGALLGESVYEYDHASVKLLGYLAYLKKGEPVALSHEEYRWVSVDDLAGYDFAPADVPFVNMLIGGTVDI